MAGLSNLKGCGTAIVTPFLERGAIDEEALARFIEFQISEGIDFLVPCGTTGEAPTLSDDEQRRVVTIVLQTAKGRVPVVAGAGGNNTAHVVELARGYEKLGVDALLCVTGYYNKPNQEGLYQHFKTVAESTTLPVIVYNILSRTGVNISTGTLMRLAEIPNICGVKEASGDISQIGEVLTRAPEGFKVFSGDDSITLPLAALGGAGVISVASNEAPRLMTSFTRACLEGNLAEARKLNRVLFPLMKGNFLEPSPGPVKAALAMMGKVQEILRLPMVPVASETKEKLRKILVELKLI
ncbi:MAG TPA: 4-hydroxy-tetrahydrodipicolinate synthase [Blastocatellia bacterium]|nr:4-hydroxy-tetrahydrodipicolinate synthase [Blastocatellia bacterium]